jgi:hypothetical protein
MKPKERNMENSQKHKIEQMPFYRSMKKVEEESGMEPVRLLLWQFAFKATPAACTCGGHEWSAFDLMLESVATGHHDWDFYRNYSTEVTIPQTFRTGALESGLLCPACGIRSGRIEVMYNYAQQCCA